MEDKKVTKESVLHLLQGALSPTLASPTPSLPFLDYRPDISEILRHADCDTISSLSD
jgi:hypothetical protein